MKTSTIKDKSLSLALRFFPKNLQETIVTLYGCVRMVDDLVDGTEELAVKEEKLALWTKEWHQVMEGKSVNHDEITQLADIFHSHVISEQYGHDFFAAMEQDLHQNRYATYTDLDRYIQKATVSLGYVALKVIGLEKKSTEKQAEGAMASLAQALQLTNILKDIKVDYHDHNHIYLPQNELVKFNVKEQEIESGLVTPGFKRLMQYQIARIRKLYQEGEKGIRFLKPESQAAILVASRLYIYTLTTIEKNDYNVFDDKQKKTSRLEILRIVRNTRKEVRGWEQEKIRRAKAAKPKRTLKIKLPKISLRKHAKEQA